MSARSRSMNQWVKRVVIAVIILAVGSMVGVLALSPRPAQIESAVVADEAAVRRSIGAYAARLTGLADHYSAATTGRQRGVAAYGARYAGMAEHFLGKSGMSPRAIAAYSARCAGAVGSDTGTSLVSQRAIDAYAARCAGIAEHYASTGK